jgi:hypothetical protein
MKKLIPFAAVLGMAVSIGTTFALADGGETGADPSHTASSYWTGEGPNAYVQQAPAWRAPHVRYDRYGHVRGY